MQRKTGEPARTVRRAPLFVFFMLAFALCLAPSAAYAGPALEIEQGYVQPDGATFQAGQRGDEFFHYASCWLSPFLLLLIPKAHGLG